MSKIMLRCAALGVCLAGWTMGAQAGALFNFDSSTSYGVRTDGPYVSGLEFKVGSVSELITALGVQNVNNYIGSGHSAQVGLWNIAGALLAAETITNAGLNVGGYYYLNLSTPITLTTGQDYIIGALIGGSNTPFYDGYNYNTAPYSASAGITLEANVYNSNNFFSFPNQAISPGLIGRYGPANALLQTTPTGTGVPEPMSFALLAAGLGGLGLLRRRA